MYLYKFFLGTGLFCLILLLSILFLRMVLSNESPLSFFSLSFFAPRYPAAILAIIPHSFLLVGRLIALK